MIPEWLHWMMSHMPPDLFEQYEKDRAHQLEWRDKEIARLSKLEAKDWYVYGKISKKFIEGPMTRAEADNALKGYKEDDTRLVQIDSAVLDKPI